MDYRIKNHLDLEKRKVVELTNRLNPIIDWDAVKEGTFIFNKNSNNIYQIDKFISLNTNLIEDGLVAYRSETDNKEYEYSKTGWYFYDESVADEVNEEYTPKLWWSYKIKNEEDFWICVACNVRELYDRWVNERYFDGEFDDFGEEVEYSEIKELDGYNIVCQ